ncbi:MAG: asparagine synthase (glutamine-hydrolyzing) [Bacteroidia bacterium]
MCGISGILNHSNARALTEKMIAAQHHRGPDSNGLYSGPDGRVCLGHNRLSIIDLSENGKQPMYSSDKRYVIVFNGEVYNYREIREELKHAFEFTTQTDTEVVLNAWIKWGKDCLDKFLGMFAFAIWDTEKEELFAARDRFGVKPFHYSKMGDTLVFASEIKAIWETGLLTKEPAEDMWAEYFVNARYDHTNSTFWKGIKKLDAGSCFTWSLKDGLQISKWYSLSEKIIPDSRSEAEVMDELLSLLEDSVKLRFRADVPVGICLSGGLDSSLLFALVQRIKGKDFPVHAFTFYTGDDRYDELPWVQQIIQGSSAILHKCLLRADAIPAMALKLSDSMDEPYGGIPTLGMSKVFETAAESGITVLLDGNGIDEGWAGYDYYRMADQVELNKGPVQQAKQQVYLNQTLKNDILDFLPSWTSQRFHPNPLLNLQIRDIVQTKIPRSMRFADRNSMAHSLELREPFLDHRLIELGLNQPASSKINGREGKLLVRELAKKLIPEKLSSAPKRGVQTPQREWLANELSFWVEEELEKMLTGKYRHWFVKDKVHEQWKAYLSGRYDNSFFIWQWLNFSILNY